MQTFDIDVTPKGINPVVYCSQKDIGRQIKFYLFDGALSYTPPANSKIFVEGRKPDNRGFSYECTYSGNEVTVILTQQMTIFADDIPCELRVVDGVNTIGTLNFILKVEESPVNENVPVSETEIPTIIDLAESQAQRAETASLEAEGFAVGKQAGAEVSSDSPYYHNNSKYYSEQAEDFKDSASDSAISAANDANSANSDSLIAEGFAVGKQNGVDVSSDSPYYRNSSKYYKEKCEEYVQHTPYIGANGNWWIWNVTDQIYIDSGVDASITLQIADVTMLAPDATPYVTNTGTSTDAVFHLYIPRGSGISSITKTGTSGLVDTYTITCSDGYTTTFTVTNGRDGTGTGDMLKSDYDSNDDVKNAGGIAAFVSDQISNKQNSTDNNLETTDKTIVGAINEIKTKAYLTNDTTETSLASDDLLPFYDSSAAAKKKMSVQKFGEQLISNRNLIDNPWFTVNQRRFTSTSSAVGYTVDRWRVAYNPASNTCKLTSNGMVLNSVSQVLILQQRFDEEQFRSVVRKMTTFSVLLSDGTMHKGSAIFPQKADGDTAVIDNDDLQVYYQYSSNSDNLPSVGIYPKLGKTVTIKAVKLEIGTISTLALDTPPNYAEELLKCQRYFYRIIAPHSGFYVGLAICWSSSTMSIVFPFPHMRGTPTVSVSNYSDFLASKGASSENPHNISSFSVFESIEQNIIYGMVVTVSTADLASGDIYVIKATNANAYIDFSADL